MLRRVPSISILVSIILFVFLLVAVFHDQLFPGFFRNLDVHFIDAAVVILSVLLGWAIQHAYSQRESEKSLKRYADGAYQRIQDITGASSRIYAKVKSIEKKQKENFQEDLSSAVEWLLHVNKLLDSSAKDWENVIGRELRLEREIELAKAELEDQIKAETGEDEIRRLKRTISELESQLPNYWDNIREARPTFMYGSIPAIVDDFQFQYEKHGKVNLMVNARVFETVPMLDEGMPLYLMFDAAMHSKTGIILTADDTPVGYLVNLYEGHGIDEIEYLNSLTDFLQINDLMKIEDDVPASNFAHAKATFSSYSEEAEHLLEITLP